MKIDLPDLENLPKKASYNVTFKKHYGNKYSMTLEQDNRTVWAVVKFALLCIIVLILLCFWLNSKTSKQDVKIVSEPMNISENAMPDESVPVVESETLSQSSELRWSSTVYTISKVHMRKEPDINSQIANFIPANTVLEVKADTESSEWYQTEYDGEVGYVNSKFLKTYSKSYADIPLSYYHQDLVKEVIDVTGLDIDEYFVYGMMYVESRFDQSCMGGAGDSGVMQIIPSTWKMLSDQIAIDYPELSSRITDSHDIESNIILGVYYLKYIQGEWNLDSVYNNQSLVLTSYNRGAPNTKKYYKNHGTYSTTYSEKVIRASEYIRQNNTWKEGI